MAVLSCKRRDDVTGTDAGEKKSYREVYIVTVEDGDQPATILTSNFADMPQVGDPHPIDTQVTVKDRSVKGTANRTIWNLTVNYEFAPEASDSGGGGGGGGGLEVLNITGGVWYEDYIAEQDFGQNPKRYKNSAGDPYEQTKTRSHPQFTVITRSQEYLVPMFIYLTNHVNNNTWSFLGLSFQENVVLFDEFNFKSLDNGFWEYTFTFKARLAPRPVTSSAERETGEDQSMGWLDILLDAGYREKDENEALIPIILKDKNKQKTSSPVSSPWPLDGAGKALSQEDAKDNNFLFWNEFQGKPRMGFWIFNFNWTSLLTKKALKEGGF